MYAHLPLSPRKARHFPPYSGEADNKEEKILTLEEVRAVLARKSKEGFTDKVKDLINYYGCHKLSEIDSKYYEEILEKIEKF